MTRGVHSFAHVSVPYPELRTFAGTACWGPRFDLISSELLSHVSMSHCVVSPGGVLVIEAQPLLEVAGVCLG